MPGIADRIAEPLRVGNLPEVDGRGIGSVARAGHIVLADLVNID